MRYGGLLLRAMGRRREKQYEISVKFREECCKSLSLALL